MTVISQLDVVIPTVGDLTSSDIGRVVRFVDDNGWSHVGRLTKAGHEIRLFSNERVTWVGIESPDGSRWYGQLPCATDVEVRSS